ncbi:hypothetical protein X992_5510 [Burkholderia pseudomallei MSHR5492]|nr:hypothetical protein X992_5510 [Burkholderia pseudomallei MSHR5492]
MWALCISTSRKNQRGCFRTRYPSNPMFSAIQSETLHRVRQVRTIAFETDKINSCREKFQFSLNCRLLHTIGKTDCDVLPNVHPLQCRDRTSTEIRLKSLQRVHISLLTAVILSRHIDTDDFLKCHSKRL